MKVHDMTSIRGMLEACLLWTLALILLGMLGGADLGYVADIYMNADATVEVTND